MSDTNILSRRRILEILPLALATSVAAQPSTSGFPDRPIRLVVPFPPGGVTDVLARVLSEGFKEHLGQPVIVDNRPGAGGLIGNDAVKAAPADGYTLLLTSTNNHIMLPLIQPSQFAPERDLASIGMAVEANVAFVVSNATPVRTLREFVQYARERPGRLNYSSSGNGSFGHFFTEVFKAQTGLHITHIPYRGAAASVQALIADEVQLLILGYSAVQSQAEAGMVRVLAQDGQKRSALLPDVQTFSEAGFPAFRPGFWLGLSAPRGTPSTVIAKLNGALEKILNAPSFQERARRNGWTVLGGPPSSMDRRVTTELAHYGPIVKKLNIKAD